MAVLINGNGNEAIYAQQDADWYAALMGGVTMITAVGQQFAYELLDANTIGVKDGVIITKEGRRIQVDTNVIDTFDIPTGAQGTTNYYIIGYHLVTDEESVQSAETFVQLMDNGTDTIPEGSFKEGDDDVYVSLYRVEQNDLTIGTITLLLPTVSDSMQQQISQINNDLVDVSNDLSDIQSDMSNINTYKVNKPNKRPINATKDLLNVALDDNNAEINQPFFFSTDAGTLVNKPSYAPTPFYGWREVHCEMSLTTVTLHEMYPLSSRTWSNTYDTNQSNWLGWKVLSNEPILLGTATLNATAQNINLSSSLNNFSMVLLQFVLQNRVVNTQFIRSGAFISYGFWTNGLLDISCPSPTIVQALAINAYNGVTMRIFGL